MPKEHFLLDSTYATRNYNPIVGGIVPNFYHSFNICFPLKYPLKNLNRITLKSVEIPLVLKKIGPLNGTTSIRFTCTYNIYINTTVSNGIVARAYTTVAYLITAINTALAILIAP